MSDATTHDRPDDNGEQFTWDASLPHVEGRSLYVLEWSVSPGAVREAVLFGCPTREDIGKWASCIAITTAALRAGITYGVWVIERGEVVGFHDFTRTMFFVFPDGTRINAADSDALVARCDGDGEFPDGTELEDDDSDTSLAELADLSAPLLRDGELQPIADPRGLLDERETYLRTHQVVACGPNDCEGGTLQQWLQMTDEDDEVSGDGRDSGDGSDFGDGSDGSDGDVGDDDAEPRMATAKKPAKKRANQAAKKPAKAGKKSASKLAAKKPAAKKPAKAGKPVAKKPAKAGKKSASKPVAKKPAKAGKKSASKPVAKKPLPKKSSVSTAKRKAARSGR